jgi:NADP-dependent 3-hydroxy acid dehydrogenase YdfG
MGKAFAHALAAAGAEVALLARPSPQLSAAADELGGGACAIPCDVSDAGSVRSAFAEIDRQYGQLDILVANAAVVIPNRAEAVTDADLQAEVGANLLGVIHTCREAIPRLRAGGGGDIVTLSSESARHPYPFLSVYAATKAGVEAFSQGLRAELRPDLIRVTVLRSGAVGETEIERNWSRETSRAFYDFVRESGHLSLSGRTRATPRDMAAALLNVLTLPRGIDVELIEVRPTA